jgi:uncharacterized protein CbrC (UPF0167 family)
MNLPAFKYHPDPVATGSVKASDKTCACCAQQRGYIYFGPVIACEHDMEKSICPWCIADGSAHRKLDVDFAVLAEAVGYPRPPGIPDGVIEELAFRTPGFSGLQRENWLTCCSDAAAFLGRAGQEELERQWPDAISSIRKDCQMADDKQWLSYFSMLDKDGSPAAYVFRCIHCGRYLGYSEID